MRILFNLETHISITQLKFKLLTHNDSAPRARAKYSSVSNLNTHACLPTRATLQKGHVSLSARLMLLVAYDACACISIADDFQITSDLPKSGVNTDPPVSEYEEFMLRNSVNPMPHSAQSFHG